MIDLLSAEVIGAFLTGVAGPVMIEWFKVFSKNKKSKNKDLIRESLDTNLKVQEKIEELRHKCGAGRIVVSQFHNGGYFYPTGKSIQKFSIVYEATSLDTTAIQNYFTNVPISLFGKSIDHIYQNGMMIVPDCSNENVVERLGIQNAINITKSKSTYSFAIRSFEGKFIGMLSIDFVDNKKTLSQRDLNYIAIESNNIGGVLMDLLNHK